MLFSWRCTAPSSRCRLRRETAGVVSTSSRLPDRNPYTSPPLSSLSLSRLCHGTTAVREQDSLLLSTPRLVVPLPDRAAVVIAPHQRLPPPCPQRRTSFSLSARSSTSLRRAAPPHGAAAIVALSVFVAHTQTVAPPAALCCSLSLSLRDNSPPLPSPISTSHLFSAALPPNALSFHHPPLAVANEHCRLHRLSRSPCLTSASPQPRLALGAAAPLPHSLSRLLLFVLQIEGLGLSSLCALAPPLDGRCCSSGTACRRCCPSPLSLSPLSSNFRCQCRTPPSSPSLRRCRSWLC